MTVDLAGKSKVLVADTIRGQGLAWAPSGKEVWFDDRAERGQFAIKASDLEGRVRTVATMPVGLIIHDISADGRVLAERYGSQPGVLGLAPGAARERDLTWFDMSLLSGLSDDGSVILLNEFGDAAGVSGAHYVRKTDGSPATRLGEGQAIDLSADGKWVLARQADSRKNLTLTPTGPGAPSTMEETAFESVSYASFFPDGKRLLLSAAEPGAKRRLYVQDLPSGRPRAIAAKNYGAGQHPVSPDGLWIVAYGEWSDDFFLVPISGGDAKSIPNTRDLDMIRWAEDGKSLFCAVGGSIPARVVRVDVATGRREPWKDLAPPDLSGLIEISSVYLTPDGKSYVYSFGRAATSDLYLVEGLR